MEKSDNYSYAKVISVGLFRL